MDHQHVSFILLAEFDILLGSVLRHQYPFPTGTDDQLLAELMIPDGAHSYSQDWTTFFLNQSPANTISPVFSDTGSGSENGAKTTAEGEPEMIYVTNLVQTKKDPNVTRGGVVKALAICTTHPFTQIFQPILVIALGEYFLNPSVEVLARLFDAVNAMDLSSMPILSRNEKLILRASERKDTFIEKFNHTRRSSQEDTSLPAHPGFTLPAAIDGTHLNVHSQGNSSTENISARSVSPALSTHSGSNASGRSSPIAGQPWADHEAEDDTEVPRPKNTPDPDVVEGDEEAPEVPLKIAFDQRSRSSKATRSTRHRRDGSWQAGATSSSESDHPTPLINLDTHSFPTRISFNGHDLNIKIPTSTFPGEVGDYSLIKLVQLLSQSTASISGPLHPHLHSNGALTHPLILLFNALITQKRIIFLGHGKPANEVANFVLAACALASGCGAVLRGFTQRAFPYTNLTNNHVMISVPGFIAGVTNPIYETMHVWDVLCNIETGKITVHKDIQQPASISSFPQPPSAVPRTGTMTPEEETVRPSAPNGAPAKNDIVAKPDNGDNVFMEDIQTSISYHFGETLVRARFTEFVFRFVRLAARYEEETLGSTKIGYPSIPFTEGHLGSGLATEEGSKELAINANRIEGWRQSDSYEYYKADFQNHLEERSIRNFDVAHQIFRLRSSRTLPDPEAQLILHTISNTVRSYDQIVELLSWLPMHNGGLQPIAFGLFHQFQSVRDDTIDLLTNLRAYPIGIHFLQGLNHFHRMAYVRLAQAREPSIGSSNGTNGSSSRLTLPATMTRSSSNFSSSSLGAG